MCRSWQWQIWPFFSKAFHCTCQQIYTVTGTGASLVRGQPERSMDRSTCAQAVIIWPLKVNDLHIYGLIWGGAVNSLEQQFLILLCVRSQQCEVINLSHPPKGLKMSATLSRQQSRRSSAAVHSHIQKECLPSLKPK